MTGWQRSSAGVYDYYDARGKRIVTGYRSPNGKKPTWIPSSPGAQPQPLPPPTPVPLPPPTSYPAPVGFRYALDCLGAAKYPEMVFQEFPQGWDIGVFANTFGDARPIIQRLAGAGRIAGAKIHLMWKDSHRFSQADFGAIAAEARKWKPIIAGYPNVQWLLSGGCENDYNPTLAMQLAHVVLNEVPDATYIQSGPPIQSSAKIWNEIHEPYGKPLAKPLTGYFTYSFDGSSAVNEDFVERRNAMGGAQRFYIWVPQFNGNRNDNEKTPRPQRTHWPVGPLIDSLVYLKNEKGPTYMVPSATWKSHAEEQTNKLDPRSNKPLALLRSSAPSIQLLADNGQSIAVATKYRVPYNDGRNRYYFTEWGFNLAEKAIRIQGHPVCRLVGGGQEFGKVNPAFRDGDFR